MDKKLKLYRQILFNAILIIALLIIQRAFIGELPGMFNNLNLVVVVLLFVLVLGGLKLSIIWSIAIGFLLDVFSFEPFGLYLITLSITILAAYFLLNSFFTNRSLYSFLALATLTIVINEFCWQVSLSFLKLFGYDRSVSILSLDFFLNFLAQLFLSLLAIIIIFQTVNFISHKLKPVFLFRPKKV